MLVASVVQRCDYDYDTASATPSFVQNTKESLTVVADVYVKRLGGVRSYPPTSACWHDGDLLGRESADEGFELFRGST